MKLGSDGCECNLKYLVLRVQNCNDWVRKLSPLMCIDMGTNEGLFNSNT